jgi:cell division protein FtsL
VADAPRNGARPRAGKPAARPATRRAQQADNRAKAKSRKQADARAAKRAAKQTSKPSENKPAKRRSPVRGALLAVICVGLLFAFVYPTRTFLDQRNQMNRAQQQLSVLEEQNAKLAAESKKLSSDAEIERLARQRYGLVKAGERAFVIVPTPTTTTTPPTTTLPGNP